MHVTPHGFDVPPRPGLTLSVVVPVYNEWRFLPRLLRAVMLALPGVDREIVLVDDGSTDGTREWIKSTFPAAANTVAGVRRGEDGGVDFLSADAASAGSAGGCEKVAGVVTVRPLMHEANAGKGRALRTAFAAASGDVVVIQDADLEYDPGDWAPMFRLLQTGVADVVYGSRFHGKPHRSLYFFHYLGNRLISLLFNVLFDQMLSDIETCCKMFDRRVLEGVDLVSDDFGIEVELSAAFARPRRWRIYECAINYYGRTYDEGKKIGWRDGLLALWYVLKFRLRSRSP